MFRLLLLVSIVFVVGFTTMVCAQDAGQKTRELIAALDKNKYKKKEKAGLSVEVYVDIKNEPVLKKDRAEYAGVYATDDAGYKIDIKVASDGSVSGSGQDTVDWDNSKRLGFTLKDARIEGALLTAVKVYENGETRKFEAVFANRTVTSGKNANEISNRDSAFGLGFVESGSVVTGNTNPENGWTNRVFLERSRK